MFDILTSIVTEDFEFFRRKTEVPFANLCFEVNHNASYAGLTGERFKISPYQGQFIYNNYKCL